MKNLKGFTIIELMITVSLLGTMLALAAPGMRSFMLNNRAVTQSNELITSITYARTQAVLRAQSITLCPSTNGVSCMDSTNWATGWLVKTDTTVLHASPALDSSSKMTGSASSLQFAPTGFTSSVGTFQYDLEIKGCMGNNNRRITVSPQGRPSVSKVACS